MNNDRINEVFHGDAGGPDTTRLARQRTHWICSQVEGERILDLGCSQGIVSLLLAREGRRVTAVDREAPALFYAASELVWEGAGTRRRVSLALADGHRLPFGDAAFDCVVLGEVIEHLSRPRALLQEVARVLARGGRLVLTTPFGLLPHPDHRQTFYPLGLLRLLDVHFTAIHLEVLGSNYICYVGRLSDEGAAPLRLDGQRLAELVEAKILAKERRYTEQLEQLRTNLRDAQAKYRRLTEERVAVEQRQGEETQLAQRYRTALDEVAALRVEVEEAKASLAAAGEQRQALERRLQRTQRELAAHRKRSAQLDGRVKQLALRLRIFDRSKAWRLIRLYWRFVDEFVRGGGEGRWGFLRAVVQGARRRLAPVAAVAALPPRTTELGAFLSHVNASPARHFVFMFSGTTFIQEHRGNRPIRLSRVLLQRRVPVLFSYWRWKKSEPIPASEDPNLLQMPIDLTVEALDKIARHDYGDKKKIFVITFPHMSCARWVNVFNAHGWQTLYDVRDDWEEFHKVGSARWYRESVERYVANNAEVVTAVSKPLQEKIGAYLDGGQVHLSPNALDTRFPTGRQIRVRATTRPPVIGYVGHLTAAWFDWEALIETARRRPEWRIEIVGHSMPKTLELPDNLVYLGPKDYRGILETTRRWSAALIPFRICALADGVDPIKVYEYLAMGLPVVSFRMPQIHDYPYVFIAHDRDEFERRIEEALAVDMDPQVIRDFLARNRWEDRVDQLLAWPVDDARQPLRALTGAA